MKSFNFVARVRDSEQYIFEVPISNAHFHAITGIFFLLVVCDSDDFSRELCQLDQVVFDAQIHHTVLQQLAFLLA